MKKIKVWHLPMTRGKKRRTPLVHMVIDPEHGALCDPSEPSIYTNDLRGVTCARCKKIWLTGNSER